MWPFLPHSLFPPVLSRTLCGPSELRLRTVWAKGLGQPGVLGQRREGGEGLVKGSGWSWGSGVGRGLTSSLKVLEPGVSCTEDAAVLCWAGVDICKRDP